MNKLRIALESVLESLAYMLVALLTAAIGRAFPGTSIGETAALFLIFGVSGLLAYINYSGRVYGYGFEEGEEDE